MVPLEALVRAGHDVALVVSRADRRRGRGPELSPSPVKAAAVGLGLPVTERLEDAAEVGAQLGVVVAFGRILKPALLSRLACVNLHFSLLPRWRGAAPVERAILAGDEVTGVCLMQVAEGLDTGDVYARVETPIGSDETAEQLRARLSGLGAELLVASLGPDGLGASHRQEGEAVYADKIGPEDRHIDWSGSAAQVVRTVRLGRSWTTSGGRRLLVHEARVSDQPVPAGTRPGQVIGTSVGTAGGLVELIRVQPEGRPALQAREWVLGRQSNVELGT